MKTDEKVAWIVYLWVFSLLTVAWLVTGLAIGYWDSFLTVGTVSFVIGAVLWLFRVTYLAGRRNR